jgi:hypothetical protein
VLPNGLFSNQKFRLGKSLHGRAVQWKMLVYFMDIWSILLPFNIFLWTFGIFCGNFVNISPFLYDVPRKIWQPFFEDTDVCISLNLYFFV